MGTRTSRGARKSGATTKAGGGSGVPDGWKLLAYQQEWIDKGQATIVNVPLDKAFQRETLNKDNPLERTFWSHVDEIETAMRSGVKMPMVEGTRMPDGRVWLSDGDHRARAYEQMGKKSIPVLMAVK